VGRLTLEQHGYQVLLAEHGQEAVDIYRREKDRIALVILDLTMPHLSGQDTLRQLVQIDPKVRVLFSSGYSAEHVVTHEAQSGRVEAALEEIGSLDEVRGAPRALRVISA
jgi:two-component system cell cycle sensor histidine kinase/response regulator CckA